MKTVIAGGTGFIGGALVEDLARRGDVVVLARDVARVSAGRPVRWDPSRPDDTWIDEVASADVVINLAGENIGVRWTEERKRRILESRLQATGALVAAMRRQPERRRTFISTSAVGFYGLRGDERLDESSQPGRGFLAEVTKRWEESAAEAEAISRLVILRFGVVLAADGGALQQLARPFKMGVGGRVGSGRQWFSWVTRRDVVRIVGWVIDHSEAQGIFNVTAPEPVTNAELTKALAKALHRPALFPVPAVVMRGLMGEMADEMLLQGQRVVPSRALAAGFVFEQPAILPALTEIYEKP